MKNNVYGLWVPGSRCTYSYRIQETKQVKKLGHPVLCKGCVSVILNARGQIN
jgi:hypothetical protein